MRTLLLMLFWLVSAVAHGQEGFIRTVADPQLGAVSRVVPTPDNGWALFSGDSLQVVKVSACGRVAWAKQYHFPGQTPLPGLHDLLALAGGGFAFVTRVAVGQLTAPLVVCLDATGGVRWSQVLNEPTFVHYPYTLGQDQAGNLVLYANVGVGNAGDSFNALTKLSLAGTLLWSQRYSLGVIWGGALNTSDNGLLARTGSRFIKTDAAGNVQWASQVLLPGDDSYYAPVEVPDGYICTTFRFSTQQISFFKLDKQGRLLWGGRKTTDLVGRPALFRTRANGQLVGVFNRIAGGNSYSTLVEFDADLQVVRQRSLPAGQLATDLCLTTNGTPVAIGRISGGAFMARTDTAFQLPCDTLLSAPAIGLDPAVTQQFIPVSSLPFNPVLLPTSATVTAFQPAQATRCAAPLALALGPDTAVCENVTFRLGNRLPSTFEQYRWSTGATTASIAVTQPGTYWLRATSFCGLDTLTDSVTITRTVVPEPAQSRDTIRCSDDPVRLDARIPGAATYRWDDGSTNPVFFAADTGRYAVTITLAGCARRVEYRVQECERLVMPNIFSPTADSINDRFVAIEMRGITAASLEIYNRWGQRLATSNEIRRHGWDGTAAGRLCAAGTYFYLVRYTTARKQSKMVKGYLELVGK